MPEMLEMATVGADLAGPLLTAPHPYETMGPALQPVLSQDRREARGPRGAQVLLALGALIERLFTIALLIALFAIVGLITAAESSTSANAALTAYLHYDIKAHLDALLTLLHIHLQK